MLDYTLWEHREMAEQIFPLPNLIKPSLLELSLASIGAVDTSIFDSLRERGLRGRVASEDQPILQKLAQVPCIYCLYLTFQQKWSQSSRGGLSSMLNIEQIIIPFHKR